MTAFAKVTWKILNSTSISFPLQTPAHADHRGRSFGCTLRTLTDSVMCSRQVQGAHRFKVN